MMSRYLRSLFAATMSALALHASAQQANAPSAPASAASAPAQEEGRLQYVPYGNLEKLSDEDLRRAKADAAAMVKDILHAYETRRTPEMENLAQQARRRADDIANETIAAERDKVLEFLGIDPQSETAVYYFVSWSMPVEMLRSYAVEAMWSGGTLVFRGVPPGKEIGKFLTQDLRGLIYGKGAAANISIDPRLFDAYSVQAVPAIVFTTVRANMQCQGVNQVPVKVDDLQAAYDVCPELDPRSYWKISGAVTGNYALQAFIDDGAKMAEPYLKAIARGWAGLSAPGKEQKPFTGKWETVLSPSEQMAAKDAAKLMSPAQK